MCLNIHTERLMQINLKEILNEFVDSSDGRKEVFAKFLISKKNIFKHFCFQCFNAWLFCASEAVKSQLKFFCLGQKKSFEDVFIGLRLLNFFRRPTMAADISFTVLS